MQGILSRKARPFRRLLVYVLKMRGTGHGPPRPPLAEIGWSWLGSFLGMALIAVLHARIMAQSDLTLLIGSFGASAVLVFGAIRSPLGQPRNLVGGHVLSAVVGVACFQLLGDMPQLAVPAAVATAIAVMHATRTLHPPGGATALIAVIGSERIHELGYLFALIPAGSGAVLMLVVGLLVNNLSRGRRYPQFWL
ncbi:HPP family protein [Thiohalorhabdus sp. Cl-TMA]|uniref:HPP family protein n=1 Tax=Thiohalorhabdus methylotrophus TaxID=3242694 RepID=A0ABV4TQT0_9GAMM